MKKIVFIFLVILLSILYSSNTLAFVLKFDNFYTDISENTNTIETNIYSIDLEWNNWTRKKINDYIGRDCITSDLNEYEIKEVVYNWNLSFIQNKLSPECLEENWNIGIGITSSLLWAINNIHNETLEQAREKTSRLINLWSTWIYADWIEENSPFDIINDFERIDSIIFSEPSTQYEWNEFYDLISELEEKWNESRNKISPVQPIRLSEQNNNSNNQNNNQDNNNSNIFPLNDEDWEPIFSKNHCTITDWDSWLSMNTIINVKKQISDESWNIPSQTTNNNTNTQTNTWQTNEINYDEIGEQYSWNYSSVNDNSQFPCDDVFCIDIEFITYQHNLLWWWFQDITIEYLINRSNEHLKKFAATSLVQSKMTMNNFELGLKDLNLPDIFHLWVQVTTKPVPILELVDKDEEKEDMSQFSSTNMMKFYYESYWLDYNKRNDLSLVSKIEQDKQSWLNSQLWGPKDFLENVGSYGDYIEKAGQERITMQNTVENFTEWNIQNEFETQLKELSIFNRWINDYVNNLSAILKNMAGKPVDNWKS